MSNSSNKTNQANRIEELEKEIKQFKKIQTPFIGEHPVNTLLSVVSSLEFVIEKDQELLDENNKAFFDPYTQTKHHLLKSIHSALDHEVSRVGDMDYQKVAS